MEHIPLEDAYELSYECDSNGFAFLAKEFVGESRWTTDYMIVFTDGPDRYGFYFSAPSTEDQEGLDPEDQFDDYDPDQERVHVRPVAAVTKIAYEFTSQ